MRSSQWIASVTFLLLTTMACGGSGDSEDSSNPTNAGGASGKGGAGGNHSGGAGKGASGGAGGKSGGAGDGGKGGVFGGSGQGGEGGEAGVGNAGGDAGAGGDGGEGGNTTAGAGGDAVGGEGGSTTAGTGGGGGSPPKVCCTTSNLPGCDGLTAEQQSSEQAAVQACVCAQFPACCTDSWEDDCVLAVDSFKCGTSCKEEEKPCGSDTDCDDGIFCNGTEVCDQGKCLPGVIPSCDDGVSCTEDFCDQKEDTCKHNKSDIACSDGKFCNGVEVCDPANGDPKTGCAVGIPVQCDDGVACTVDTCDDATGACIKTPNDALCDNGIFCDGQEVCTETGCSQGVIPSCDDGVTCTVDSCDEATQSCQHTPNDLACDNGLTCDGKESCNPMVGDATTGCAVGMPIPCGDDGIACTVDACNESTGQCEHKPDNTLCGNAQFCVPGVGNGCVDATPCSNDAECDDGDLCNGKEVCKGICQPGVPVNCDDGVECTVDSCNKSTGKCSHKANHTLCDNGLKCDGTETCDTKLGCVAGTPVVCDDSFACTIDLCQEPTGTCISTPVDAFCDDNKLCNGAETCNPQKGAVGTGCLAGNPYVCPSDGIACTVEVCDPKINACVSKEDDSKCACGQTCNTAKGGCGNFCEVKACSNGKVYACGDCIDNDGDCKIDSDDSQCLGPCDNTENAGPSQGSGCYFAPPPGEFNPVQKCAWNGPASGDPYPATKDASMTPVVINLTDDNGDGKVDLNDTPDIAFISYADVSGGTNKGILRVLSGKCNPDGTMAQHWVVGTNEIKADTGQSGLWFDFSGHIAAGDIDGDGVPELVATLNGGGTIAVSNKGKVKWVQKSHPKSPDHRIGTTPSIANIDGVGDPEIITGRVVLNGKDGSLKWKGTAGIGVNGAFGPVSSVADIDLDGKLNVLAGNTAYKHDGTVLWTYARVTNLSSTANCTATGGVCDGFTAVGNFDANDQAEVVIVSAGRIFIVNHDGTPLKVNGANVEIAIPKSGCAKNEGGPPTIADFDGDGQPEIGVAGANYYIVADLECLVTPKPSHCSDVGIRWKVANNDCSSRVTGSSVFDFDGDGNAEVIYNDEVNFRILDGKTGTVLFQKANHSRTRLEMPIVADTDNDGKADVVFVENDAGKPNSARHGLRVWGDATNSWVSTRRIWNQHSYHVTNVSELGVIPLNEKPNWLEPTTSTVSGKMNNFRQNLPEYDALAAPDLSVTLNSSASTCPTGVQLSAKVCNKGLLKVMAGVPVSFYNEASKASLSCAGGNAVTTKDLNPNECQDVTCVISLATDSIVRACVDNAGFSCADGGANECNESNNTNILSVNRCPNI